MRIKLHKYIQKPTPIECKSYTNNTKPQHPQQTLNIRKSVEGKLYNNSNWAGRKLTFIRQQG